MGSVAGIIKYKDKNYFSIYHTFGTICLICNESYVAKYALLSFHKPPKIYFLYIFICLSV